MSFFKKYPLIAYEFNGITHAAKDILRRTYFTSESKPYSNLYDVYDVPDGGTTQSVSMTFYKTPYYHWVVMMFNEINNPYFDWPMQQIDLDSYCREKYGVYNKAKYVELGIYSEEKYGSAVDGELIMLKVRHYEIDNLIVGQADSWVNNIWTPPPLPAELPGQIDQLSYPVTFYEYENDINDEKRRIKILKPELLGDFVRQFETKINDR